MSNWQYAKVVPTEKWRSAMTVARELSLQHNEKGYRLFSNIKGNRAMHSRKRIH